MIYLSLILRVDPLLLPLLLLLLLLAVLLLLSAPLLLPWGTKAISAPGSGVLFFLPTSLNASALTTGACPHSLCVCTHPPIALFHARFVAPTPPSVLFESPLTPPPISLPCSLVLLEVLPIFVPPRARFAGSCFPPRDDGCSYAGPRPACQTNAFRNLRTPTRPPREPRRSRQPPGGQAGGAASMRCPTGHSNQSKSGTRQCLRVPLLWWLVIRSIWLWTRGFPYLRSLTSQLEISSFLVLTYFK